MNSTDPLRVTTLDSKYTVILSREGHLRALRYGQEWRDCVGDGLILTLAQDIETLTERLKDAQGAASTFNRENDQLTAPQTAREHDIEKYRNFCDMAVRYSMEADAYADEAKQEKCELKGYQCEKCQNEQFGCKWKQAEASAIEDARSSLQCAKELYRTLSKGED